MPLGPADRHVSRSWLTWLTVGLLLALHALLALSAADTKCATLDETFHLTGGYSYWALGDFRLQPENGNLAQRWAALPLWLEGFTFPSREQAAWHHSDMFNFGEQFVY